MSDTNIVIAQLKNLMSEVLELRDQKPEAQTKALEFLKNVINALHLGRKTGAKRAAVGPTRFDTPATEYLFGLKPDLESGEPNHGNGWWGLYLGMLSEGNQEMTSLPQPDMNLLKQNHGAILHESADDDSDSVTGQFFPLEEDAVDQWEESISGDEPELSNI
jgi:hypothetical protein